MSDPAGPAHRSRNGAAGRPGRRGLGPHRHPGERAAPVDIRTVAHLVLAARAARVALATGGRSLSRDALAERMREDGQGVSDSRASLLLKILKAEQDVTPFAPTGTARGGGEVHGERPDAAADRLVSSAPGTPGAWGGLRHRCA